MAYYLRRVKKKCEVRGCRNTDSFAVSKTREPGNSVIICKECLKAFAAESDNVKEPKKGAPVPPPPLFFSEPTKEPDEVKAEDESKEDGEPEGAKPKAPKKNKNK